MWSITGQNKPWKLKDRFIPFAQFLSLFHSKITCKTVVTLLCNMDASLLFICYFLQIKGWDLKSWNCFMTECFFLKQGLNKCLFISLVFTIRFLLGENNKNAPKGVFSICLQTFVSFYCSWSQLKSDVVVYLPVQTQCLAKLLNRPKCSWPIKLQHSCFKYIFGCSPWISLHFCILTDTQTWYLVYRWNVTEKSTQHKMSVI